MAAAGAIGAALTGGVAAQSLAQPAETALERQAANYIRFREDVAAIEALAFDNAEIMRDAHRRFAAHDSEALADGWVAYAALVAAESPAFAEALRKEVNSKKKDKNGLRGTEAFLARLAADPTYPRKLDGADEAVARVLGAAARDSARFAALGEAFKAQAYALQKTNWGKARISAGSERLSEAAVFASARPAPVLPTLAVATEKGVTAPKLAGTPNWAADWGKAAPTNGNSEQNAQVVVDRALNLAARYAVTGVNDKTVSVYAKNDRAGRCLSLSALVLKQCIAATRTPYEEAFCLGEHALIDVADCIGWVAGAEFPDS